MKLPVSVYTVTMVDVHSKHFNFQVLQQVYVQVTPVSQEVPTLVLRKFFATLGSE